MKMYTLEVCENLISKYINDYHGEVTTLSEGVLGLGLVILHNANGKKITVIRERYLNANSSGHTIRQYNKMPEKYNKLLEEIL